MKFASDGKFIAVEEAELKPNKFSVRALSGILITLFLACILNELTVFEVDRIAMWGSFVLAVASVVVALFLVYNKRTAVHPATKYVLVCMILMLSLAVNVFFNISVVLLLLLPVFVATRYRSRLITIIAIVGSEVTCILAPILAWLLNAWSVNIMIGYLETTCNVSIELLLPGAMPVGQVLFNILVYMCLPQIMVLTVFGFIAMEITTNSISGMKNREKVQILSEDLTEELKHVEAIQNNILFSIADIIESRDTNTGGHVKRTSEVVRLLVEAMHRDESQNLSTKFCDAVVKAAPLHDIGKIAIDDAILRKTGPLTEKEREQINSHAEKGAELIHRVLDGVEDEKFVTIAANIALSHHECYDGSGYPHMLKGDEIPLEARIMAIADIYDTLVSKRCYKDAFSTREAYDKVEELMGKQFDPQLNKYFEEVLPEIEKFYS